MPDAKYVGGDLSTQGQRQTCMAPDDRFKYNLFIIPFKPLALNSPVYISTVAKSRLKTLEITADAPGKPQMWT